MSRSAHDGGRPHESRSDAARPEGQDSSGLTHYLVVDPTEEQASRAELCEAIRRLVRERDYLRDMRDIQLREHEVTLECHRKHAEELRQLRASDGQAHREQIETLKRELAAHCTQASALIQERDTLLADREAWRERAMCAESKGKAPDGAGTGWFANQFTRRAKVNKEAQ